VTRRPNILVILADDMGYGDFSCFNDGASATPVLDDLVDGGTCLSQHYSASPVCAPARASLLTGRYPHRTGAVDTLEARGLDRIRLGDRTIADLLSGAGYATGLVGKWHNGALDDRYHPNRRGFDEFAGFRGGWSDYWHWFMDRNGAVQPGDGRYLTDVLTEEAVAFVRRHQHEPFFLHVAYSAPHFPLQAPDDDVAPFRDRGHTSAVSRLYGMLRTMDRGVGAILDELDGLGLAEDTLVLFSSDNGPQFSGDGDDSTERFNCGFRGAKLLVYEGGIRLPAVLRWPAGLPAGAHTVDALVHFTDWLPTLLAAADVRVPDDLALDGVDVLPLLRQQVGDVPTTRFWQWNRYQPVGTCNAAMRDRNWKLVRPAIAEAMEVSPADLAMDVALKYNPTAIESIVTDPFPERTVPPPPPAQLFDVAADPMEEHDLAAAQPARVARMEAELGAWFADVTADG
jgi:arylsulfatase A